jgi:glutamine amidotransferase
MRSRRRRGALDEGARVSVVLADYGAGNLRSVCAALERAGASPRVATDAASVREAPLVVIAGVGHLESAARGLEPVSEALRERAAGSRPVLGICVGMQLLFEESEEGGRGLGLLAGGVRRLSAARVPHMGWNELALTRASALLDGLDGRDVYFAHSYAAEPANAVAVAEVEHEGTVVAAVESGLLGGVQFHPERSGAAGARVLENAVRWSRNA